MTVIEIRDFWLEMRIAAGLQDMEKMICKRMISRNIDENRYDIISLDQGVTCEV